MENLSKLGGNYMCSAQKRIHDSSGFRFYDKDVDKMFDCIAQTIRAPRITDQEVL